MSNELAIASATAALTALLGEVVGGAVPGARVTHQPPSKFITRHEHAGVNVFLYQAVPNSSLRNSDLPLRGGASRGRSRTPLDLGYLFTFYGNDQHLEPQRLLGSVVRVLHENAVLSSQFIRDLIDSARSSANPSWLAASDLDGQVEEIRFTPFPLNLERISKFWNSFFNTPYHLSIAYHCSVVVIEGDMSGGRALPVQRVVGRASARAALALGVVDARVPAGGSLQLTTPRPLTANTRVRLGNGAFEPTVDGKTATLELTDAVMKGAGVGPGARAVWLEVGGQCISTHQTILLQPAVLDVEQVSIDIWDPTQGKTTVPGVQVQCSPPIGRFAPSSIVLYSLDNHPDPDEATSYTLPCISRADARSPLQASIEEVPDGTYVVQVDVGGTVSPLRRSHGKFSPHLVWVKQ